VTKFTSTLLLIPVCLLPVSMAYSADAPDGTIRVAAISALAPVAVPKIATHQDAPPGKAAPPARVPLDLRAPDLRGVQWQDLLRAMPPSDSDEAQAVAVVAASLPPKESSNTYLSLAGIGSLYWAARHPSQAWRVLLPMEPGDDSDAYADVRSRCALIAIAPTARPACQ
jgi:hypothetical protein